MEQPRQEALEARSFATTSLVVARNLSPAHIHPPDFPADLGSSSGDMVTEQIAESLAKFTALTVSHDGTLAAVIEESKALHKESKALCQDFKDMMDVVKGMAAGGGGGSSSSKPAVTSEEKNARRWLEFESEIQFKGITKLNVPLGDPKLMEQWLQYNREVVMWFSAAATRLISEAKLDFARVVGKAMFDDVADDAVAQGDTKENYVKYLDRWQAVWNNIPLNAEDRHDPRDPVTKLPIDQQVWRAS